MKRMLGCGLGLAMASACGNGLGESAPLCRPWVHQLRDQGAPLTVLGAAAAPQDDVQVFLARGTTLQHAREAADGWSAQDVDHVEILHVAGAMALDHNAQPVLM